MEDLKEACNRACKEKRKEKIINIIWTIAKIAIGLIAGNSISN